MTALEAVILVSGRFGAPRSKGDGMPLSCGYLTGAELAEVIPALREAATQLRQLQTQQQREEAS